MGNNLSKAAAPQFSAHWTIAALRCAHGWLGQEEEAGFSAEVGSASDLFTTGWSWGLFLATENNFGVFLQFSVKYQEWQYRR